MRVRLNVRFMVTFRFAWKKRKSRLLLCVGLHEGSLTEFTTTKGFSWEHFLMGETGSVCGFRVICRVRFRVTFRVVWTERKRGILLCVGLREGSQMKFRSTRRLQLGAIFYWRNWRYTCFLGS